MRRAFKEDSAHEKTNLRHDRSDDRATADPHIGFRAAAGLLRGGVGELVGRSVPATLWNAVAGKRAIPANQPLIRRFTPPSHMGEGIEKNVHRPKFIIDFSRSLCGTAVFLYPLTKAVSLCYLMSG